MTDTSRINAPPVSSPLMTVILIGLAFLGGILSTNPLESAWTCILLLLILRWFWWQNNPGIMLFCLVMQFIEIHTALLEANQAGITLDSLFFGTGGKTFWMSSISLLTFALGVRTIWTLQSSKPTIGLDSLRSAASRIQQSQLLIVLIATTIFNQALDFLIPFGSSLRQLETYASGVSETILIVLAIKYMVDRKHGWSVFLIFSYVVAVSFYSFFSDWKDPIIVLLVAAQVRIKSFGIRETLRISPILLPSFLIVFVWQNVKGEYREFLNGGQYSQQVVVSQSEALKKFQELATEVVLSNEVLAEQTLDATYRRIGYIEYFSNAVAKVPLEIDHENGKLLQANLAYALIPRFLSPGKLAKDDKAKVEKYTDFYFGTRGGSSFSLGHYCEAYIDWGRWGMMLQLFIIGLVAGGLFMFTIWRTSYLNPILSLGILWVCIKPFGTFQSDMITFSGTAFWGAVCHLFVFFPIYKWANKRIQGNRE